MTVTMLKKMHTLNQKSLDIIAEYAKERQVSQSEALRSIIEEFRKFHTSQEKVTKKEKK